MPHSEIHGSRPILGSPWLIAEYHVLHRLLLPRHPPNALLALDLTRKEQGPSRIKALLSRSGRWFGAGTWLVYLTWIASRMRGRTPRTGPAGHAHAERVSFMLCGRTARPDPLARPARKTDVCISLHDVNAACPAPLRAPAGDASDWTVKQSRDCFTVESYPSTTPHPRPGRAPASRRLGGA